MADRDLIIETLETGWDNLQTVAMLYCLATGHKRDYNVCRSTRCTESRRVVRLMQAAQRFLETQNMARESLESLNEPTPGAGQGGQAFGRPQGSGPVLGQSK